MSGPFSPPGRRERRGQALLGILVGVFVAVSPKVGATSLADIIERSRPSVAFILVKDADGKVSSGTGFVVRPNGLVATAAHIISRWDEILVRFQDGKVKPATPVWFWRVGDVALLMVSPPVPKPLVLHPRLSSSIYEGIFHEGIRQGDEIIVLGFPLSTTLGYEEVTVTRGIVSAFRTESATSMIQIDAALNPGNSGGPVLNTQGQVVGLVSSKVSNASSIGFAVLVSELGFALESYQTGRFPFDVGVRTGSAQLPAGYYLDTPVVGWEEAGKTTVLLRDAAKAFGAEVSFDATTGHIRVQRGDRVLELRVGSSTAVANGTPIDIGQKTEGYSNSVPLRLLVESLGGQLRFDSRNRMAYVDMP